MGKATGKSPCVIDVQAQGQGEGGVVAKSRPPGREQGEHQQGVQQIAKTMCDRRQTGMSTTRKWPSPVVAVLLTLNRADRTNALYGVQA